MRAGWQVRGGRHAVLPPAEDRPDDLGLARARAAGQARPDGCDAPHRQVAQGASQAIESANEIFNLIISSNQNIQNVYYKKRLERINLINKRSKLNYFAFHISNSLLKIFRNKALKIITKNKNFINNYLGKVYK